MAKIMTKSSNKSLF